MRLVSGKHMISIIAANSLACLNLSKLVPTCLEFMQMVRGGSD